MTQSISPGMGVDMYKVTVSSGQQVEFDVDVPAEGGLVSSLRLLVPNDEKDGGIDDQFNVGSPSLGGDHQAYLGYTFKVAITLTGSVSFADKTTGTDTLFFGDPADVL